MGVHRVRRRVAMGARAGRGVLTAAAALAVTGGAAGVALAAQVPTAPAVNEDHHEPRAGGGGQGAMSVDPQDGAGGELQGETYAAVTGGAEIHSEMHAGGDTEGGTAGGGVATPAGAGQGSASVDPQDGAGGELQGETYAAVTGGAEIHSEMHGGDADSAEIDHRLGAALPGVG